MLSINLYMSLKKLKKKNNNYRLREKQTKPEGELRTQPTAKPRESCWDKC